VAVNTDDLVQPSRKTRHSDPIIYYATLAARIHFFQEQYMIGTPIRHTASVQAYSITSR